MLRFSWRLLAPLAVVGLTISAPAVAKEKTPMPRPAQIQELYNCRDIADPTARLACYDREVGELSVADDNKEISFADKETVTKTRRGLFGFSLPNLGGLLGGDDDEITSIETVVKWASMDRSGRHIIAMDDDAVWSQIDVANLPRDPKPGQKVTIKAASMGTYFVSVNGQRSIRMKRDR